MSWSVSLWRCRPVGVAPPPVLAVLLALALDQAQFALQALVVGRQVAVVLQQLAVLLQESRRALLLPLVLLQLGHQLLSGHRDQQELQGYNRSYNVTWHSTTHNCLSLRPK